MTEEEGIPGTEIESAIAQTQAFIEQGDSTIENLETRILKLRKKKIELLKLLDVLKKG